MRYYCSWIFRKYPILNGLKKPKKARKNYASKRLNSFWNSRYFLHVISRKLSGFWRNRRGNWGKMYMKLEEKIQGIFYSGNPFWFLWIDYVYMINYVNHNISNYSMRHFITITPLTLWQVTLKTGKSSSKILNNPSDGWIGKNSELKKGEWRVNHPP